ncbi:hypothetical protein SUGI_1016140 [Cryptomeria japonica]|nr:hypothetical protein SUGI_1016140 [Cryptomeria japonica]
MLVFNVPPACSPPPPVGEKIKETLVYDLLHTFGLVEGRRRRRRVSIFLVRFPRGRDEYNCEEFVNGAACITHSTEGSVEL